jgi:hypothetical protein
MGIMGIPWKYIMEDPVNGWIHHDPSFVINGHFRDLN